MPETPPPGRFPTTHWSRVVRAGAVNSLEAHDALATLCEHYWYPIYAFIRRKGHGPEDALDLAQEYFARLIEKGVLAKVDPIKGRFRAFLKADCGFFLADWRDREIAQKRGGGLLFLSIDIRDAEGRFLLEPAHAETAERLFERDWAMALIARTFDRLDRHYAATGRIELFRRLKATVSAAPDATPHAQIAIDLGLTEGSVRVAAHRLRARFAVALREEVAATIDDPDPAAIEDELTALFTALGS
jgi:hypothetical protein